jgi:hypothetical protein
VNVADGMGSTGGSSGVSGSRGFVCAPVRGCSLFLVGMGLRVAVFGAFLRRAGFFFAREGLADFFRACLSFFAAIPPP